MSRPQNELDVDESSGVTTLRPVPSKPARLFELSEGDSTAYFSASELLERGKALAARTSQSLAAPAPVPEGEPERTPEARVAPETSGWLAQIHRASFAKKMSAILLPITCALLLGKPLFRRSEAQVPGKAIPSASLPTPSAAPETKLTPPMASAALPTLSLPHGVSAARAAVDSIATGDFLRALVLYRELARRDPKNPAYREAARILSERGQTRSP